MKLKLPNITLLGIDCVNVERLQVAMDVCQKDIEFGAVKLLTSLPTSDGRLVNIPQIKDIQEYSRFCAEELVKYVDTDYVLIVQYDGFILNPASWTDEFLKYDYIGAPWLVANWSVRDFNFPADLLGKKVVGNGGFSIRSKKFLEVSAKLVSEGKILTIHPEDVSLCIWHKDLLDRQGISIAPAELAGRFSIEGDDDTYEKQFGFHGFSWTDIDKWINEHSEYQLIVDEYKKQRRSRLHRCLIHARDQALKDVQKVFQDKAIEGHIFGSVARRDSDPYSDLDVWFTIPDADMEKVLENRFEYYAQIGKVIHVCEAPQNRPIQGIHSSVLYKTYIGLLVVDINLCPKSTSFLTADSRKLFGEIDLPQGEFSYNPQKVVVDETYRIDFIIGFTITSIKRLIRKETDALDSLFREYENLSQLYNIKVERLTDKTNSFDTLRQVITNLQKIANEKQITALSDIAEFSRKVEMMEY
jgi:predicted nucleotidyltransferase